MDTQCSPHLQHLIALLIERHVGMKALARKLLLLLAVMSLTACGNAYRSLSEANAEDSIQPSQLMPYKIGPADMLTVTVRNHDDLSSTVTVRPDGMISFPLLGEISVVGLTPEEMQSVMATSLQEFINIESREVSVVVDEVHSYAVSVLGEVRLPGRFEFQNQITVLDALAQAGGLTEFASRSDIVILRHNDVGVNRIRFDYRDVMRSGSSGDQMWVFPGDIIVVP